MAFRTFTGILALLVLSLTSVVVPAAAQSLGIQNLSLSLNPPMPGPNEPVEVSLQGFSVDLSRAEISWSINGTTALVETGATKFSFTTQELGVATVLEARVAPADGSDPIKKSLTVTPAELDLLWEARGISGPPFYKGKVFPSSEADLRIVAIPTIALGAANPRPETFSYQWTRNGSARTVNQQSGFGKHAITIGKDLFESRELIAVEASTVDGRRIMTGSVSVPEVSPFVLFYEDHPLRGVLYQTALVSPFLLPRTETTVRAVPVSFSLNRALSYLWRINGTTVPAAENGRPFLVLESGAGRGTATVGIQVTHPTRTLQEAARNLTVQFGQ